MGVFYRIRQGLASLVARMGAEDWALVDQHLSPSERLLFEALATPDQVHSVRVLRSLLVAGVTDPILLKAALLHDVGKSRCRITVVHRTTAVLLRAVLGGIPAFDIRSDGRRWWLPLYVLANHPRIGAYMLAKAGTEERVWRLVELHQLDPCDVRNLPDAEWVRPALVALRRADNQN